MYVLFLLTEIDIPEEIGSMKLPKEKATSAEVR